jgi:hypothetical protein
MGKLDRVQLVGDAVELVDYKTGRASEKHRRQLMRYAVLWWRLTGEPPARVTAQYLEGVDTWPISLAEIETTEREVASKIVSYSEALKAKPADAIPGSACARCAVRARCDIGWALGEAAAQADGRGGAELILTAVPGDHGFLARLRSNASVAVVYETAIGQLLPQLDVGHVVRVLDGVWNGNRSQLELKAWSEVFVLD